MELSTTGEATSCDAIWEFSGILYNPSFITAFTKVLHLPLSYARPIQINITKFAEINYVVVTRRISL
jgi:hypothetical protein